MSTPSIDLHDLDAEEAVLAAALANDSACIHIVAHLHEQDFWSPDHRKVFAAMRQLAAADKPIDAVTVKSAIRANGAKPEDARRLCDLVGHLDDTIVVATNAPAYVTTILAATARREVTLGPIPPLAELLAAVCEHVARYVVLPSDDACRAIALWVAHTHVFAQFDLSPYLNVSSPEKQSGKTRLAEVLSQLVARPWLEVTPSEAVVYRKIEAEKPTLLLDEVDAVFGPKASKSYEGLRGLFNAGNRKSTKVSRCVAQGKNFELVDFEVFSPKAFFGIGDTLPSTVADRAIPIRLQRRRRDEPVERFRVRKVAAIADVLRADLQAWAESADLHGADPELPEELGDREQDVWEPLLAIADTAGERWPEWSRQAAVDLAAGNAEQAGSSGTLLLAAVRSAFAEGGADRLFSEDLAERLNAMEEWPWDDMTKNRLASHLKQYRIHSSQLRVGSAQARGYYRDRFADAFARYLPAEVDEQEAF